MSQTIDSSFPVRIDINVAWGDMDALGHVNNAVFFRYFESGRIAYFDRIGATYRPCGPILASTQCDFLLPLAYPDQLRMEVGVIQLGNSSFHMGYRLHSTQRGALAAKGLGICVWYDYDAAHSTPLPTTLRDRILAVEHGG